MHANPSKRTFRFWPRRWFTRTALILGVLLLLVIVVTQLVLWTNVPRDLVLERLQKQLGLRVTAASLSTGWLGNTDLRDVTIALPLADDALLRVPSMRVKHTTLFGMAWGRPIELDRIELREPLLVVRQDAGGRWNVQQVMELLGRTGGKQVAAEQQTTQRTSRPQLPTVRVTSGTLHVIDRGGRTTVIQPVNVTGDPENPVTWKYEADAGGGTLRITGRLAPGRAWAHEVKVHAQNVQTWARPWTGESTAPAVSVEGEWRGEMRDGGVAGRLVVSALNVGQSHATGALGVRVDSAGLALRPEDVVVHSAQKAVPELRVTAGKLGLDGKSVAAEALTLLSLRGAAQLDGRYDWSSGSADAKLAWSDFATADQRISHSGTLTASLRTPLPGRRIARADLTSTGKMPLGTWQADVSLSGTGSARTFMDWDFAAPRLSLAGRWPVRLDGLAATMQTRGTLVSLNSVRGPGGVVARGSGHYDRATRDWKLRLDLSNLPRPLTMGTQAPLAITFNADGSSEHVMFHDPGLSIRGQDIEVRVDGSYVYDIPKPVALTLHLNNIPRGPMGPDQPRGAYLRGKAELTGTAWPLDIDFDGTLVGRDVPVFGRTIGEVEAELNGHLDEARATLQTKRLAMLGGAWELDAVWPEDGVLGVHLGVKNLSLDQLGGALRQPMRGAVDARWALSFPTSRLNPEAVNATAAITARDLAVGKLVADHGEAAVVLADGVLRVQPVRLRKGKHGEANFTAEMDVREIRRLTASVDLAAWPFEFSPQTKAELWGGMRTARITLPGATREEGVRRGVYQPETKATRLWISGPIDVTAALTLKDQPFGDARLVADVRGNVIDLRSISFDGLDGTVQGHALVDLDRPLATRGSVFFDNFNAARISDFFPENELLVGLGGRFSGSARVAPAPGPQPLEPLRVVLNMTSDAGRYRTIDVGPLRLTAFTDLDRVVIEDSPQNPTTLELAGGLVRAWGRFSVLEPGDELNAAAAERPLLLSQVQLTATRLDLDQIVHAFTPNADPMPGKLSISLNALAATRPRRRAGDTPSGQGVVEKVVRRITADGRVELTESDLANLDVIAFLYDAMRVGQSPKTPQGSGAMTFHAEDGVLSLNNIRYFNRGTEVRALVDIGELWRMPASPISGTAVGAGRPFRDVKLPFLSTLDLDSVLTALQTDLTTVGVYGSVHDPRIEPLALSDLGAGMRGFILGDFSEEQAKAKADAKQRGR